MTIDNRKIISLMKLMEKYGISELEIEGLKIKRDSVVNRKIAEANANLEEKSIIPFKNKSKHKTIEELIEEDPNFQLFKIGQIG